MTRSLSRPLVSFVTMSTWGMAYVRAAEWLKSGFERLNVPCDVVFLDGPTGVGLERSTREVKLGSSRARWSFLRLYRYLDEAEPVLTLSQPAGIALLALVAGRLARRAVVPWEASVPQLDVRDLPRRLRAYPLLQSFAYPSAPAVAAVSEDVRQALLASLKGRVAAERISVIPYPVHAEDVRRRARPVASRGERLRFCSVGRLVWQKGHDVLIEAFAEARGDLGESWELVIVGGGPLRARLEELALVRGLSDHISFMGSVDNPFPLMASSDVYVHAARWEGFGLAVAEALSLGLPVIATRCGGISSAIASDGESGLVVEPEDPRSLAEAVVRAAQSPELRQQLGAAGPERVSSYAPERVAQQVVALAEEVGGLLRA